MRSLLIISLSISLCACANMNTKKNSKTNDEPRLTRPDVTRVWVPDQIEGNTYIIGHWKYIIENNSAWAEVRK